MLPVLRALSTIEVNNLQKKYIFVTTREGNKFINRQ